MADELDPIAVARRLAWLREHFVAETVEEARARFERERPARAETFEEGVARRLAELRELDELTQTLHSAGR
jgi:hypothetical protein